MIVLSKKGIVLLKRSEGFSNLAYKPSPTDPWTIGYGSTIVDSQPVYAGQTITREEAEEALQSDIIRFSKSLNSYLKVSLNQNQFDAIFCLVYNIGLGAFKKSTLLKKLNMGDFKAAALEFTKWKWDNGKISTGLEKRRIREQQLFLKEPEVLK